MHSKDRYKTFWYFISFNIVGRYISKTIKLFFVHNFIQFVKIVEQRRCIGPGADPGGAPGARAPP